MSSVSSTVTTTFRSIATTHVVGAEHTLSSAMSRLSTATNVGDVVNYSQLARGARETLAVISAQDVLATATDSGVRALATQALIQAFDSLHVLADDENLYDTDLSRPANIIYLVVNAIIFFYVVGMLYKSRFHWFNVSFFCGYGMELAGFIGRVLSFSDNTNLDYYLLQFVCLTVAPAFIMAGIYFLFGQNVVIYGRAFSPLPPMWYSYLFIGCDVVSLIIQAIGGAMASAATSDHQDTLTGTNVMIVGIAFQVFAMSIFLCFWFEFLRRHYFLVPPDQEMAPPADEVRYAKFTFANFFRMIFYRKSIREYKRIYREPLFTPEFASIRSKTLFHYFPLAITSAVIVVYIRCVYRVVELAQGFSGYLITHEVYLMVLDALMISICGLIFLPFHPVWTLGTEHKIGTKMLRGANSATPKLPPEDFEMEDANQDGYQSSLMEKQRDEPKSVFV